MEQIPLVADAKHTVVDFPVSRNRGTIRPEYAGTDLCAWHDWHGPEAVMA